MTKTKAVERLKWYKMQVRFHETINNDFTAQFELNKTILVRSSEGRELEYTKKKYMKVWKLRGSWLQFSCKPLIQ